jgi:hypothetical protein
MTAGWEDLQALTNKAYQYDLLCPSNVSRCVHEIPTVSLSRTRKLPAWLSTTRKISNALLEVYLQTKTKTTSPLLYLFRKNKR